MNKNSPGRVMGEYKYSAMTNAILIAIIAFPIVTSVMGIKGALAMVGA